MPPAPLVIPKGTPVPPVSPPAPGKQHASLTALCRLASTFLQCWFCSLTCRLHWPQNSWQRSHAPQAAERCICRSIGLHMGLLDMPNLAVTPISSDQWLPGLCRPAAAGQGARRPHSRWHHCGQIRGAPLPAGSTHWPPLKGKSHRNYQERLSSCLMALSICQTMGRLHPSCRVLDLLA